MNGPTPFALAATLRDMRRGRQRLGATCLSVIVLLSAQVGFGLTSAAATDSSYAYQRGSSIATTREGAINEYRSALLPTLQVANSWSGSVGACDPGTVGAAYQQAGLDALNYARSIAGLQPVVLNEADTMVAQSTALLMRAKGELSHMPPDSWPCWTPPASEGAANSNLAMGVAGAAAMVGFLDDPGQNNIVSGHRQAFLDPGLTQIGIGNTDRTCAVYFGGYGPSAGPEWREWPVAGFFPQQLEPNGRWSVARSGANFEDADVHMTVGGQVIPVVVNPYGDSVTWDARMPTSGIARPGSDATIDVTVTHVVLGDGSVVDHTYTVTLVDAAPQAMPTPHPSRPVIASAKALRGAVRVSWSDAANTDEPGLVYVIKAIAAGRPATRVRTTRETITITSLSSKVQYQVRVRRYLGARAVGPWSRPVNVVPL